MALDEINVKAMEGQKRISKAEVGISVKKRVADTRVHVDVKEIVATLRTRRTCDNVVTKMQATGDTVALQRATCRNADSDTPLAVGETGRL